MHVIDHLNWQSWHGVYIVIVLCLYIDKHEPLAVTIVFKHAYTRTSRPTNMAGDFCNDNQSIFVYNPIPDSPLSKML